MRARLAIQPLETRRLLAVDFSEDFNTAVPNPNLEGYEFFTVADGVIRRNGNYADNSDNRYMRTVDADYIDRDFRFELSVTTTDSISYVGIGRGDRRPGGFGYNEPWESLYLRIHSPSLGGATTISNHPATDLVGLGLIPTIGTHRVRLDKIGNQITFAIDAHFNDTFVADMSRTITDYQTVAPFLTSTNSRLFFGTVFPNDSYDDWSVAALPTPAAGSIVVTTTEDSGPGSLRQAILDAEANPGPDTVVFNIPMTDPNFVDVDSALNNGDVAPDVFVIRPITALPPVTTTTIIDGRSQSFFGPDTNSFGPEIVLDGNGLAAHGLTIAGNDSAVLGLNIQRFGVSGVGIDNANNVTVAGNYIGTNAIGTAAAGNAAEGVSIANSANVTVGGTAAVDRNIISGNGIGGVAMVGGASIGNQVVGNYIGVDRTGLLDLGNAFDGIYVGDGGHFIPPVPGVASQTQIRNNVVSGNNRTGVVLKGSSANVVSGNVIGANATGTAAVGNGQRGIVITTGAAQNLIGTNADGVDDAAERNLISGNAGSGIRIVASASNIVAGNWIGLNAAGTAALPNASNGLLIDAAAANNRVGTNGDGLNDAAEMNVISGNTLDGIFIDGVGTSGNVVAGNRIGTNPSGTASIGNGLRGVDIFAGATGNLIGVNGDGASTAAEGNLISGNGSYGVLISGAGTAGNVVAGNRIGTNALGTSGMGNALGGVAMITGAINNRVGTDGNGLDDALESNLISGNNSDGVRILNAGTSGNVVAGNLIGISPGGTVGPANAGSGILIGSGASNNRIGTNADGAGDALERNVLSGNASDGVLISGIGTSGNLVAGNLIGTNPTATAAIGNGFRGVEISSGASGNWIGANGDGIGDLAERNIISGNSLEGVRISGSAANVVAGNIIGAAASGAGAIRNLGGGIVIVGAATNNRIGTNADGIADLDELNVISGNSQTGVRITGAGTTGNVLAGNLIGVVIGGDSLANLGSGVFIDSGAAGNRVGGVTAREANTIAFNGLRGIAITESSSAGNAIRGNAIHHNGSLGIDLGANGVTPNDAGDSDTGGNNLQNFPLLGSLSILGDVLTVTGTFNGAANAQFTLEFFGSLTPDPSGSGEGEVFLGTMTVMTDGGGNGLIDGTLTADFTNLRYITSTATDAAGNTSEFSPAVIIPVFSGTGGPYTAVAGTSVPLDRAFVAPPGGYLIRWDLDNDDVFGETGAAATRGNEVGLTPTFNAAGLTAGASHPVALRINDGLTDFDSATTIDILAATSALILDDFDAPNATGSVSFTPDWVTAGGSGLGRNGNSHLDFNESFLPPQVATYTFNVPATGRYRVSATWFNNPGVWSPATRFEVSDGATVLGTTVLNQGLEPNDFIDAGSSWEDVGVFDITGATGMQLQVRILSGTDSKYTVADAIRIQKIADLSPAAEINVTMDGQHGATIDDNTGVADFGATNFNVPVQRTFTITNVGTAALELITPVTITGVAFSVISQPAATVAPGASTTFVVQMSGAATGSQTGAIRFGTNDTNENAFNFALSGVVRTINIIDDGDPGFVMSPGAGEPAGWGQAGGPGRDFDFKFNRDNPGSFDEFATWTFNVTPGQYRVSTTWAFGYIGYDDAAPFTIFDGSLNGPVVGGRNINQQIDPNDTDYPTGFEFPLGTSGSQNWERVDIVNITSDTLIVRLLANDSAQFALADSILIDRLGDVPAGAELVVVVDNQNAAGGVNYGQTQLAQFVDKTFTIRNTGRSTLNITSPITIGGPNSQAFTLQSGPSSTSIAPGGTSTFVVRMTAAYEGLKNAAVNFTTNDFDESSVSLAVSGEVLPYVISDDLDAGYSQVGMVHNSDIGIAYRNDFSLANTSEVQGPASATWTFNNLSAGSYYVALTWFDAGGDDLWANNTQLIVRNGGVEVSNVHFSQRNGPSGQLSFPFDGTQWQILAFFTITGPNATVTITNDNSGGLIMADGVLLNRTGGGIPPGNGETIGGDAGSGNGLRSTDANAIDAALLNTAYWDDDLDAAAEALAADLR